MNKILDYLKGKKTYITVAVGIAVGVAQGLGYHVPPQTDVILGFLGLGFHRAGVQAASEQTTKDVDTLVKAVIDSLNSAAEGQKK